jgi:ribonucleoside-triphosphate reductase (thioredoxin)
MSSLFSFPSPLQDLQYTLHYSRYQTALGRREQYPETVERAVNFLRSLVQDYPPSVTDATFDEIKQAFLNLDVMPSMRLIAMAGDAASRDNTAIYNCSFLTVCCLDSFVDALSILMAGCGVGYSVESRHTNKLPKVMSPKKSASKKAPHIVVKDSADGWANAFEKALAAWFSGRAVTFDYSKVRPAGSVLATKGGRASGPGVLQELFEFSEKIILGATGRQLTTLECHDIMCMIGKCVVSGGVRRSAMIALFDEGDEDMLTCKDDIVWGEAGVNTHRASANNSVVWTKHKSRKAIKAYVDQMHQSLNGEPGIFSRHALKNTMESDPFSTRAYDPDMGTNPCGEIALRDGQFCNLSIVVARPNDTEETLIKKARLATIVGTIQSLATHHPYLRRGDEFVHNSRMERLIGVDVTGQMDSPAARNARTQRYLRHIVRETNRALARQLGIAPAASYTCVKPSGNSSVLLDCAPGLHARYAPYYIRRIRVDEKSPVAQLLIDQGFPHEKDVAFPANVVFSFPISAPNGAITQSGRTALDQLEYWKQVKLNYTTHNPSCTINYREKELSDIAEWLYTNQDIVGGLSFLPTGDTAYPQAPYEEISQQRYEQLAAALPHMDLSKLSQYEENDNTTLATEYACTSGLCEI